jgi:uncharacterized protein YydD (DUF2326 family)
MFLKSLTISSGTAVIRDVQFRMGINLIVDESSSEVTGNDVGKTTVLRLVDYCLGGKPDGIYIDPESKKEEYTLVKEYLRDQRILVTLVLKENLVEPASAEIVIERNFLSGKKDRILTVNGRSVTNDEFYETLMHLIFPNQTAEKPTFRQIISHNIRYDDDSINNTLKTLGSFGRDVEYETLYLYLLGCEFGSGNLKQDIMAALQQEQKFKARLEKHQPSNVLKVALGLLENEIGTLHRRKSALNINEHFETDLQRLNTIKFAISRASAELSKLKLRRNTIEEARADLQGNTSEVDAQQLRRIYDQAYANIGTLPKQFEELLAFHNAMIWEKVDFITKDLPALEQTIAAKEAELKQLLHDEHELATIVAKSDSFAELEVLIIELNEKFRKKGEYQRTLSQIEDVDREIAKLNTELEHIDAELFSDEFEALVQRQVDKFNQFFASISLQLYGEQYALTFVVQPNRLGQKLYKFATFNTNFSSGKKQGEISCFDIAYTLFADAEGIPCLHFLLNDKKELMHDNQLVGIARLANTANVQFVASILKDKLPAELNWEDYYVVKLSPSDKLFRIEQQGQG